MSHSNKLQQYRQTLRKQHLSELFTRKRLLQLSHLGPSAIPQVPTSTPALTTLIQVAAAAQHQCNIQALVRSEWMEVLWMYTHEKYADSVEQVQATSALGNMLMIGLKEPPCAMRTRQIIGMMQSQRPEIVTNVLNMLFNLIYDHPKWRDDLVTNYALTHSLNAIFMRQDCCKDMLMHLLRTIHITICSVRKDLSLLPLLNSLMQLFTCIDFQLLPMVLTCTAMLGQLFPHQLAEHIREKGIFGKLAPLVKVSSSPEVVFNYLKIVQTSAQALSHDQAVNLVLPVINKQINCSRKIKIASIRVLYTLLQAKILSPVEFWKENISQQLRTLFQDTDDQQFLVQLCYVFSVCLLNLQLNVQQSDCIKRGMNRAKEHIKDVEVLGYIDQTLFAYKGLFD